MQRTPSLSSAAAAGGASGSAGIVRIWVLGLFRVDVPADVAVALTTLGAPLVHWVFMRLGVPTEDPVPTLATAAAPATPGADAAH